MTEHRKPADLMGGEERLWEEVEIRDADAVCVVCRWKGGHADYCARKNDPWPTLKMRRELDAPELTKRLRATQKQADRLKLAICGGEDAPGYAASLTVDQALAVLSENYAAWDRQTDRATALEDRVRSYQEQAERLAGALERFTDRVTPQDRKRATEALAAYTAFKAEQVR
jgi:hypothetical protein